MSLPTVLSIVYIIGMALTGLISHIVISDNEDERTFTIGLISVLWPLICIGIVFYGIWLLLICSIAKGVRNKAKKYKFLYQIKSRIN
jgi:CHASE2 domain-containing sensor protein